MSKARQQANLSSDGNLFADISNDRVGVGSVVPTHKLHVNGTSKFDDDVKFEGTTAAKNIIWDKSADSLKISDDVKLNIGTGNDLDIYHTTSGTSWIRHANTSEYFVIEGQQIDIRDYTTSKYRARFGTKVELRYDNTPRFETTNTGAKVTGNLEVTGVMTYDDVTSVDSVGIITARDDINIITNSKKLKLGASGQLNLTFNGTNSVIQGTAGDTIFAADSLKLTNANSAHNYFLATNGGAATLYHANNAKLATTSSGATVTGSLISSYGGINTRLGFVSGGAEGVVETTTNHSLVLGVNSSEKVRITSGGNLKIPDNAKIELGGAQTGSGDLQIWHDGGDNYISGTGNHATIFKTNGAERLRIRSDSNITQTIDTDGDGFIITAGDMKPMLTGNSNRSAHNNTIFGISGKWNNTEVGRIAFEAGADTTNKDDGKINFYTRVSGGSLTSRLLIDSNGRLTLSNSEGIKLSAKTSTLYSADGALSYYATDNGVYLNGAGADGWLRLQAAGSANDRTSINISGHSRTNGDEIYFKTNSIERLRIDSDGVVQIQDSTNSTQGNAQLLVRKGTSTAAPETVTRTNSYIHLGGTEWGANAAGVYTLSFGYTNGTTGSNVPAYIGFKETTTSSYTMGDLVFGTKAVTSDTAPIERLRITSAGNIIFGVQTGSSTGINNAHIKWFNGGSDYWSGTAGDYRAIRYSTYYMSSDDIYGIGVSNSMLEVQATNNIGWFAGTAGTGTGRRNLRMKLEGANGRLQIQNGGRIEILSTSNSGYDGALLKLGYVSGETRAIDIGGGWSNNESKSISFIHGSSATQMVGQINCMYNGTGSNLRWGKLYHGGSDSSTYTMELVSSSTTTATLKVTDQIIVGDPSDTQDYSYATAIFRHKSPRSATGGNTGWPYWLPLDNNRTQNALVQITAGGNGGTSTAAHGPIATVVLGEYYDSAGLITVKGGGSASPSDQGTGHGKDLMIAASNSDNTSGKHGGRLFLQSGSGYQGSAFHANHGETWINQFGGDIHIGGCNNHEQKLVQHAYPNLHSSTATVVSEQSGEQWEAKYVTQQGMSNSNDQAWYKYEFHGGYASRAHNLDLWVTWTTGHAAGSGCGRWHVGVWEPHGGHFGINCKRQYFMDFNSGGTYYSWGIDPSVYLYRATTPNSSGTHADQNYNRLYFAVRGRIGSNPNYGGALRHCISCTVHENNYRGNPAQPGSGVTRVRNKFEYVGETNPSDLGTYYGWDNLP